MAYGAIGPRPKLPPAFPVSMTGPGNTMTVPQYGAMTSQFGPTNNLIGTQLTPTPSADTSAARGMVSQSLGSLQGPDRGALAQQTFQQLRDLSEPQFQNQMRQVGQNAAKFGRIGAGMTTSELGDVASNRDKYLGTLQQQLATDAAGQTLQDRLGVFGAAQSGLGQLSGLDQQQYGNMFGERGYQAGLQQQGFQNDQQINALLAQLGFGGNEGPLQQLIAQQYGNQANTASQGAGDILRLLMSQQRRPGTTPGVPVNTPERI